VRDIHEKIEAMDPVYFLRQYSRGQAVSKQMVQLIYELKERYSFSNGVINVLLEFCMLENNYKITRADVLNLAEDLFRRNIATGKEALHYLKSLQKRKHPSSPPDASRTSNPESREYNMEYVETNIALLARQLHELRKEIKESFLKMDQQLDQIESRLKQLSNLMK
jgi:replication initiation and membrane attachment protein DnaB